MKTTQHMLATASLIGLALMGGGQFAQADTPSANCPGAGASCADEPESRPGVEGNQVRCTLSGSPLVGHYDTISLQT
ncbi:hypothetical protein [Allokutzneria albata]|uniref:hypothetical protein n=1 Tax=Allokutzneria albata TaxID=211114 RepID=UPI0004C44E03|nr:hypothetical protein [Allokutzneria albata]